MKIAFVDAATNKLDAFEHCANYCHENLADVEAVHVTTPDLSKIPVGCKKAFNEGADVVLAFATVSDDEHVLQMVAEKIMQVELEAVRYVFLVTVFDDEYRSQEQLLTVANDKIAGALEHITKTLRGAASITPTTEAPPVEMPDLGVALTPQEENAPPQPPDMHSLF